MPKRSTSHLSHLTSHISMLAVGLVLLSSACRREAPATAPAAAPVDRRQFHSPLAMAGWPEPGSWPQFAHDPLHTGRADVDLGSGELQQAWEFRPGTHVWEYQPGYCVWSSPIAGTVGGRPLMIAGCYDRSVYAIDARTGRSAWQFQPGDCVFASPALAQVNGRALVFLACVNRSLYAVDAMSGQQVWSFETRAWSFTTSPSLMSSPSVVQHGTNTLLVAGVWNSDRAGGHTPPSGEVVTLDAQTGRLRWRRRLGGTPVTSPAVARLGGEVVVVVSTWDGRVCCLSLEDGAVRWEAVLNEETRSSPSIGWAGGRPLVFIGTRLHSVMALDAGSGRRSWRVQTGYWVDSTPAWWTTGEGRTSVVAGSYDRSIYAWSGESGREDWHYTTGNYAYASPAAATLKGQPVVCMMSWDDHLYLLDGRTGQALWRARSGPLLWSHAYQGDSLWASPVVARLGGDPMVFFAAGDGSIRAYAPRGAARMEATTSGASAPEGGS